MEKSKKQTVTKVYCDKCDLIFDSRDRFEKHLDSHYSNVVCEICPVDTVISKLIGLFRRKSHKNLE